MTIFTEAWQLFLSFFSGDLFEVKMLMNTKGAWLLSFFVTLFGGILVHWLYGKLPWLERNLERGVIIYSYMIIAAIIFWGVIDRFVFSSQVPWSTTIPPLLFMIMAWFGCAYNVKLRTHLSFSEVRNNLPRSMQMMALTLDAVLWFGFAWVVLTTSARATVNSAANFQIVLGTDNVMQWWFIITVPLAFLLVSARAIGNFIEDYNNYKSGAPLIQRAVIGGDV